MEARSRPMEQEAQRPRNNYVAHCSESIHGERKRLRVGGEYSDDIGDRN